MKKNMLKLASASTMLLLIGTIAVSATAPAEPVEFEPFQYHVGPRGPSQWTSGHITSNNTRTHFWTVHNTRRHRAQGIVNDRVVVNGAWASSGLTSVSQQVTHASNARVRTGIQID